VAVPTYDGMISVVLPNPGIVAVGQNRIFVTVDQDNEIAELPSPAAELNNGLETGGQSGIPLTFIANTAKVAFPPRYAVIGGELEFIASTTNVLAPERDYLIQISSDRKFNTLLADERVNSPGGVVRYRPTFAPADSTTYYWRISPDSISTEGAGLIWSESSFTWVADQPEDRIGWAMQDMGQTIDGAFENILGDTTAFGWNSARNIWEIRIFNAIYKSQNMPRFMRNNQRLGSPFQWNVNAGVSVLVIDSTNIRQWDKNPGTGLYNSFPRASSAWDFDTRTEAGREGFTQFITEGIEPGRIVMVYSRQRGINIEYYNEGWLQDSINYGNSIFSVLEDEGALQVRRLADVGAVPYVFTFQKSLGPISEVMADSQTDTIEMYAPIFNNWETGNWKTINAGPTLGWESVEIGLSDRNLSDTDSILLRIIGTTPDRSEVVLREQEFNFTTSRNLMLSLLDVSNTEYPFLRAELDFFDVNSKTSPTVSYVYFNYLSPGDVAISPQVAFSAPDSIDQGQELVIEAGYQNISRIPMDSILVKISVTNSTNQVISYFQRQAPLASGGQDRFTFNLPSEDYRRELRYNIEINPDQDQPEDVLFNNFYDAKVKVGTDLIDPELQLFFDGVRINNGDLVSAKPEIHILLRDENRFLDLNDTSAYFLELTYPTEDGGQGGDRERLSFSDSRIEFLPATTQNNTAEIFFRPTLTTNGTYTIEIVGQDRSLNFSGASSLLKDFEVINEQMVANVLAYPNPFTTQTRFVYTLTGNEVPEMFRIQIMTVSGRVVRDIDLLATESLKIGTHQTDFAWDGTDEYGDLLANGVYLYRIITADGSGNALDQLERKTDQFFERDLGKVVILR
jgi:hypothetical protein